MRELWILADCAFLTFLTATVVYGIHKKNSWAGIGWNFVGIAAWMFDLIINVVKFAHEVWKS